MSAQLPSSETSPESQSVSAERGIDRLFSEMAAMYGSKFADLWCGTDIDHVKNKWVEKLKPFAAYPGVVQSAMKALDFHPNPPTLPVFIGLCRDAMRHVEDATPKLPYMPTADDRERIKAMANKLGKELSARGHGEFGDYDPLLWAKRPKTQKAMDMVIDGAKRSEKLRVILENLRESGVVNSAGKLIQRYKGQGQWVIA